MYNTKRLILKPFTKKDLPAFQTIMADPRIGAWLAKPEGLSPETSRMMLERFQNHWKIMVMEPLQYLTKRQKTCSGIVDLNLTNDLALLKFSMRWMQITGEWAIFLKQEKRY